MAGVEIDSAYIGISGAHIKSFNSRGVVAVSGKNREITREDIKRVIDQSKALSIPPDREIIHIIPQEFVVDEQDGIKDPLGMSGIKLEVNVHIVTSAVTSLQNLKSCIERAGVATEEIVLNQIATSAVRPDPRRAGARRRADRHRGGDDRGGHLRARQSLVLLDHPDRRRQLHQRHRRRPPDAHPGGREDQEEVRLRRRPGGRRTGDDRGPVRRQGPEAPRPLPPDPGRHHPAAGRGDLPARGRGHQEDGLREIAELGHRPDRRDVAPRRPGRGRRGDLRPARAPRRPGRRRRAGRPGQPRRTSRRPSGSSSTATTEAWRGASPGNARKVSGPNSPTGSRKDRRKT